jgi:ankyrin repeat protein
MSTVDSIDAILPLSNTQARDLAGKHWIVDNEVYRFKDYSPGQPPWRTGSEGKAFPLLREKDDAVSAYVKFFNSPSAKRLNRTRWLVSQDVQQRCPQLAACPRLWLDSRTVGRPEGVLFDITGCLAYAAPGETWLELKFRLSDANVNFDLSQRLRCVRDLIAALASLEQAGIQHGDLSPQNIVIDLHSPINRPMLRLIDFDGFASNNIGPDLTLTVGEGGTYGTDGYCPPDLTARAQRGDTSIVPYSDRHARDMLMLEILCAGANVPTEQPPRDWERGLLEQLIETTAAQLPPTEGQILAQLSPAMVFKVIEENRTPSTTLAQSLGMSTRPIAPSAVRRLARMTQAVNWPAWISTLLGAFLLWSWLKTGAVHALQLCLSMVGMLAAMLGWHRAHRLAGRGLWASECGLGLNSGPVLILTISFVTSWISSVGHTPGSRPPATSSPTPVSTASLGGASIVSQFDHMVELTKAMNDDKDAYAGVFKGLLKDHPGRDFVSSKDDKVGGTPLHWAAANGYKDLAASLLANKAEVNAKDNRGETPLHWAAGAGFYPSDSGGNKMEYEIGLQANYADVLDIVKMMLANKAEVNARDDQGKTPLHWAAGHNYKEMVELLLANNADANAKDNHGETPFDLAANQDVADLLARKSDSVDVGDRPQGGGGSDPKDSQEPVKWSAASHTALAITGDITFRPDKITIKNIDYPLALLREIDAQHSGNVAKIFGGQPSTARLYRTKIPKDARLVNGNDICGTADANWVLVADFLNPYTQKPELGLAFFSGDNEPNPDGDEHLCGTFGYSKD